MDFESILESPIVLIAGAVLVVAVAVFIFINGSKKDKPDTISAAETANPAVTISREKQDDDTSDTEKQSPFWKLKRSILSKIRSSKKPDVIEEVVTPESINIDPKPSIAEEPSSTEFDTGSEPDNEADDTEVSDEEGWDESVMEDEIDIEEELPDSEDTIMGTEDDAENVGTEDMVEDTIEPNEQPEEIVQPEPEKPSSGSGGDIFSMFMDEEGEENETSKFAKNLDPVDINDLIQKVDDIKRYIRK